MRSRSLCLVAALLAAAGCTAPAPAPPAAAPPAPAAPPDPYAQSPDALVMTGINLYMHRARQAEGVAQKPEFWVHANAFSMQGDNVYKFENARAVIYGEGEQETIVIESLRGQFEQDRRAVLQDEVTVHAGAMTLKLADIVWEKPEGESAGEARSDSHVAVDGPEMQVEARALRLRPDAKEFELTGVTGTVRFGKDAT
ncbi:MAG: LPS export ABC transporter periplasmic protein LptC [Candidatus Hydrogenedens sp.]|nr:LPS export ABC transporter periplasmic protein LptC [Candidatus Hydrogenedens sp.]